MEKSIRTYYSTWAMTDGADDRIIDFVTGKEVRSTPEEIDAVQPFSKILVEDYGYPKECLQTHPQWRVKVRPSDTKKEYPVDIAIFDSKEHTDDNITIIIECKKKNRKDGKDQLEDYLRFSKANFGIWYNGKERLSLIKIEKGGRIEFKEVHGIPKFGERIEDVGLHKRKDLKPSNNLKTTFKSIRNYLASHTVGITRDELFASQLINIIFCKIYDERFTKMDDMVKFRVGINEKESDVAKRVKELFSQVKKLYNDVIEISDEITLDDKSIAYIVDELQLYSLQDSSRDAVGEAFEVFIGPSLKGGQGQFFTPRNVVDAIVSMVDPKETDTILDPACGSGGFLVQSLRYVWKKVEKKGKELGWPDKEIEAEKQKVAIRNIRGIDRDEFLSKVAKAYLAILGDGRGGIHCENSLDKYEDWSTKTSNDIKPGSFDIIVTNPPFGKKMAIDSENVLKQYDLGYKWKKENDTYVKGELFDKQPPQILFIERCLDLLKPGGKLGIVLLESIFGMPKYQYVVNYIQEKTKILAIVSMPEDLFQPNTHAKCCILICEKYKENESRETCEEYDIFMGDVKWCGHDSRGNPTLILDENGKEKLLDEIPIMAKEYRGVKGIVDIFDQEHGN